jgi:predicted amidophosphoribosyltransferase
LCGGCFEALPLVGCPFCARCGAPTAFEVYGCGECSNRDFGFDGARAPFRYEGVGKELVHALKYKRYTPVVEKVMAPLMANLLDGGRFDGVVPVPLHRARLAKRGFNQAELMARGVAERINAPVLDKLKVVRRTRDQVELSAEARRTNVAGAYASREPRGGQDPPRRRRLHHRRHLERVRQSVEESGCRRGPGPDPMQDLLVVSHQPSSISQAIGSEGMIQERNGQGKDERSAEAQRRRTATKKLTS